MKDLATTTNAIAQVSVGAERVRAILDADGSIPDDPNGIAPESLRGEIELRHVAFGYDTTTQVLSDVSVRIQPCDFVGVVGLTGSGKSTLMSLLPRFYDVTSGELLLDGEDVRRYKLAWLRNQIGYVMQETILFRGTILDNTDWVWDHSSRRMPFLPVIHMSDGTLRYRASRIEEFVDERERSSQLRRKRR